MTTTPHHLLGARRRVPRRLVAGLALVTVGLTACDRGDGRELVPARPDQNASVLTTTTTPATTSVREVAEAEAEAAAAEAEAGFTLTLPWADDTEIPAEFTCAGAPNVAPRLVWGDVPVGTLELAVVMTDNDTGFVNWVMSGITVALGAVEAGVVPPGAVVSLNGNGAANYAGPCPTEGTHTYLVELYAVDQQLELTDATPAAEAVQAIEEASVGSVAVAGVVTR